jgi:hypothetical protein
VPSLRAGQIVVMDKLGAHRPKRIGELIEQQGCELLYLPAYSPDYNPIEEAFGKVKNLLAQGCSQEQRGFGRSDRRGAICGHRRRCPGLLRARRLSASGSTTMKRAVSSRAGLDSPPISTYTIIMTAVGRRRHDLNALFFVERPKIVCS